MGRTKDITGQRFGHLVAIRLVEPYQSSSGKRYRQWLCQCDCGNQKIIFQTNLIEGKIKSCGCEQYSVHTKHGEAKSRLYSIWRNLRQRCNNPKAKNYDNYGGRGIKVCDNWNNAEGYTAFKEWALSNGYRNDLTIDRINNNGNYEPSNCRWATSLEQNNNQSSNIMISYNNEIHTLSEWSRLTGINRSTLKNRYEKGQSPEEILYTPVDKTKSHRKPCSNATVFEKMQGESNAQIDT